MKTILMVVLSAIMAFALAGCAPPDATNTTANTNTNANTAPTAGAPTADALMALETKAWEAWKNKDGNYFEGLLADNMIPSPGEPSNMSRAEMIKMIVDKCDVKSFATSEPHVISAGADAAVLSLKRTAEGTCDGKPIPSPVIAATVYVRSGAAWKAAYHNEVPITEPKGDAKANMNTNVAATSNSNINSTSNSITNTNMSVATNRSASPNSNAGASNSNTATGDAALTDTLIAMERKGWEAWKAKDASGFVDVSDKDFAFVDSMGKATYGKANVVKLWTTDNPCNASSVNLSEGHASMISRDAAILTYKGTAEGTCGNVRLEPLWATTVYVREGDRWKAVYILETPMRKM